MFAPLISDVAVLSDRWLSLSLVMTLGLSSSWTRTAISSDCWMPSTRSPTREETPRQASTQPTGRKRKTQYNTEDWRAFLSYWMVAKIVIAVLQSFSKSKYLNSLKQVIWLQQTNSSFSPEEIISKSKNDTCVRQIISLMCTHTSS